MKILVFKSVLILFALSIFGVSCKPDGDAKKEISVEDFHGKWDIYSATRNGSVTKSLENGFFVFRADNTVKTNIFGAIDSFTFSYEKKVLNVVSPSPLKMKVVSLQNDSLELNTELSVFDLEFFLTKGKS